MNKEFCDYCLKEKTKEEMSYPHYCKECVSKGIDWTKHPKIESHNGTV